MIKINKKTIFIITFLAVTVIVVYVIMRLNTKSNPVRIVTERAEPFTKNSLWENQESFDKLVEFPKISNIFIEHSSSLLSPQLDDQNIIAVNRDDMKLYNYKGETEMLVFNEPVKYFDYVNPLVVIVPFNKTSSVVVLNIKSNTLIKSIDVLGAGKISSITVDTTKGKVYILGNYQTDTRDSTIFELDIESEILTELSKTKANQIKTAGDKLVLYEYSDGIDDSSLYIFDPKTDVNKHIYGTTSNGFSVSPSQKRVLIHYSGRVIIYDIKQEKTILSIATTEKAVWLDNENILFLENNINGIKLKIHNILNNKIVQNVNFVSSYKIRSIVGFNNNDLFMQTNEGEIIKIRITDPF